ncbi:unnamed protein product [Moneuplotes crassus]|uniref:Uncharacterized protein n=1 Tax=Euplotes crassus TaxID=5936 RepID=A0AAD2D1Y6_EUPCR|nr:unnamed protein product [Moneuplotes crassus]
MNLSAKSCQNLGRTFHQKYPHYTSHGYGRDTYILRNNGGFCLEESRAKASSTLFTKIRSDVSPAPKKGAGSFKYIS